MSRKLGHSFLEVMISVNLLAILTVSLVDLVPFGNVTLHRAAHRTIAVDLARQLMKAIDTSFWVDNTNEDGVPIGTWNSFTWDLATCLSNCGSPPMISDSQQTSRQVNTVFPPVPYLVQSNPPILTHGETISTQTAGMPDTRLYYFYVKTQNVAGNDPNLRLVQVIVFWNETNQGPASGPNSWQQAGYRFVSLSQTIRRKGGPL